MNDASPTLESVAPVISNVCSRFPIRVAGVFGSVARGTSRPDSDVDVYVLFDCPVTPELRRECEESLSSGLGREVSLLTSFRGTNAFFRETFAQDRVAVYAR